MSTDSSPGADTALPSTRKAYLQGGGFQYLLCIVGSLGAGKNEANRTLYCQTNCKSAMLTLVYFI